MAILYISHDLLSVATLCHRVAILHDGQIVEIGKPEQIFRSPQHPSTQKLVAALPHNPYRGTQSASDLESIEVLA